MLAAINSAWGIWCRGLISDSEIAVRKAWIGKVAGVDFEAHCRNDHVPFLKGCPTCIESQSRQKPHWRQSVTSVGAASFDISGPFVWGFSYDLLLPEEIPEGVTGTF